MGGSASRGSERINRIFSEKIFSESDQRPDGDLDFLPLARRGGLIYFTGGLICYIRGLNYYIGGLIFLVRGLIYYIWGLKLCLHLMT